MKNPLQLAKAIHLVRDSPNRAFWGHSFLLSSLFLILGSSIPAQGQCVEYCDYGLQLTGIGYGTLQNNTTGMGNTAVGHWALASNSEGLYNTATGEVALGNTTTGSNNTANGWSALAGNQSGNNNTAIGYQAMGKNAEFTAGSFNVATGANALFSNTTGSFNTATGINSLLSTTTGISNTGDGAYALQNNTTGFNNTANGVNALVSNTTGSENTANGNSALSLNTTGLNNTADGSQALLRNTTGNSNIALGFQAGQNLTVGASNIDIGNDGVAGESRKIRIGTQGKQNGAFVAGIYGVTVSRGIGVIIDSTGHLGTSTSSARFKDNIKPMDKASEAIHALKPVTFCYKKEFDPEGIPQFGLVAEEVAKVRPDLVVRDEEGKPYTVRYEAVNAMLLNEFLKEHRKVEEQETAITELRSLVAQQRKDFQSTTSEQQREINALIASLREDASQIQRATRPRRAEGSNFATGRIRGGDLVSPMVAANQ